MMWLIAIGSAFCALDLPNMKEKKGWCVVEKRQNWCVICVPAGREPTEDSRLDGWGLGGDICGECHRRMHCLGQCECTEPRRHLEVLWGGMGDTEPAPVLKAHDIKITTREM